jgi:hypothetical protein
MIPQSMGWDLGRVFYLIPLEDQDARISGFVCFNIAGGSCVKDLRPDADILHGEEG